MPFDIMYPSFFQQVKCPACGTPVPWGLGSKEKEEEEGEKCNVCGSRL